MQYFSIVRRQVLKSTPWSILALLLVQSGAAEPRFRPNQANLSAAEQTAFVDALHSMKQTTTDSGLSVYDSFVKIHGDAMADHSGEGAANPAQAHQVPTFLPWHRQFIWNFESALLDHDSTGTLTGLPYWNWALDRGTGGSSGGSPWDVNFLGGNGNSDNGFVVDSGPFSTNWFLYDDPEAPLQREFSDTFALGTPTDIWRALQVEQYDAAPWNPDADIQESFRNYLEGWGDVGPLLHNLAHVWVGGTMSDVSVAPFDPVFWMHHAFVDLIWSEWQSIHGIDNYLPEDPALAGFGADDSLWEFRVVIGDTFDLSTFDDVGYVYESTTIVPEPANFPFLLACAALILALHRRRGGE